MKRTEGTILSAPVVAGGDTTDDIASAIGSEIQGNFQRFTTIAKRDDWSSNYKSRLFKTTALVETDADGDAVWFKWDGVKEDGTDGKWVEITAPSDSGNTGTSSGITLNDKTQNATHIKTINLESMSFKVDPDDSHEATIAPLVEFVSIDDMGQPTQFGGMANAVSVMPPLQVFDDPNTDDAVKLEITPGTYEPMKGPGMLAYLSEDTKVIGKDKGTHAIHKGALWFDDVVTPSGPFIVADKVNKTYGIQEFDGKDPNVTGGQDFLIAYRAAFKGVAPDDGIVRIALVDKTSGDYIEDVNGHIMGVQHQYKAGDDIGHLTVIGVLNAKGLQEFRCVAIDDFADDTIVLEDRTEGVTGLMIQALSTQYKTGDALQQFELDTAQNIEFSGHYLGPGRASIEWLVQQDVPLKEGTAAQGQTLNDGLHFYNVLPMRVGVQSGHLVLEDNGTDLCDFSFGKIFSAEETLMLRGREVKLSITLTDKDSGFTAALMKWTGKPDQYTKEIFKSRSNGSPVLDPNWSQAGTLFISEDVTTGDHVATKVFTVPDDANNYAFIIYPANPQVPLSLNLKQFTVDVVDPFIGYVVHAPEMLNELHLIQSDEYKTLVQDVQGYASLRYTIVNSPLPMPVGELRKGSADITLDPSVNKVAGSAARGGEGAIVFNAEGKATVTTTLNIYPGEKVPSGQTRNVNFWYSKVGPDGSFTKIDDSELFSSVVGGALPSMVTMPSFTLFVNAGDRIALSAQADIVDGAFIECVSNAKPMVNTKIRFKEISASTEYEDDLFADVDVSQFDQIYTASMYAVKNVVNAASASIPLTIPTGADLVVMDAVKKVGGVIRPVKNLDYSYSNGTLSVSFGETADVKLTIGIFV